MPGQTRVSWLIPVRDGERWLGAAVESALDACTAVDEVVVVDDGSRQDPSAALPDDLRVRLIRQKPLGIAVALEKGRAVCDGEWIARLDADDVSLVGRIDAQIARMRADPNLAAVGGRAKVVCEEGPVPEGMAQYIDWVNRQSDLQRVLLVESPLFHPAVLLRASAVAAVGGYRNGDFPEDYALWLSLVAAGWRIDAVAADVVCIRDRPDRLTRTDPRYRRAAFDLLKQAWLTQTVLATPKRVVVWGAGRTGKRWLRWLRAAGHTVPVVVDEFGATQRQGVPVVAPERLRSVDFDILLVAVGVRGARALIRAQLAEIVPTAIEGQRWWAVC